MTRTGRGRYSEDWPEIAHAVKSEANWRCLRCGHAHDPRTGYTLTVHHLDLDKGNNAWWNLLALCQRCHLSVQARVDLDRPWVMTEHSEWFRPFAAGWYAFRYLGELLSREEVDARLDELLLLERAVVLGGTT